MRVVQEVGEADDGVFLVQVAKRQNGRVEFNGPRPRFWPMTGGAADLVKQGFAFGDRLG